jgi:hypothetical protein
MDVSLLILSGGVSSKNPDESRNGEMTDLELLFFKADCGLRASLQITAHALV